MLQLLTRRCLVVAFCTAAVACGQAPFHLRDGDRVVFYGDSITDQRLYTTFVETYAVTRFPHLKIDFVHSGWGGDRVSGGAGGGIDVRLERDVFAYRPTVMTVMLGMNDGQYRAFDQGVFDQYAAGYRHIVRSVKQKLPDLRLTLILPSPFDDVTKPPTFRGGYNSVLVRYGESVKRLAADAGAQVADLNRPVIAALRRAKDMDPETAGKLIPDRVHPGAAGHLLMAASLLAAWNAPSLVSAVELDAAAGRAIRAENTEVSEVAAGTGLVWMQRDRSLPMPFDLKDKAIALAVRAGDLERALNWQPLRVANLRAGTYALLIDGERTGSFSAQELAKGINLAQLPTPMARQAELVHSLTLKHNNVHFARWRTVEVPLPAADFKSVPRALEALDALEREVIEQQRAAAQPKLRRFELRPE